MKNALNSVKMSKPSTNAFDLSHDVKLSCNMGDLIPVLAMECIPGDRVRIGCESLHRLAPMLAPLMHRVDVRVEYFFVPNRILWENWGEWITNGGDQPTQATLPAHPVFQYSKNTASPVVGYSDHKLLDYMGLPDPDQGIDNTSVEVVSALPFGAYQKIWAEYYRDQNLQDTPDDWAGQGYSFPLIDGDNGGSGMLGSGLFALRKRCWESDYFTKALPFAQKGQPVSMPLGFGDVPVKANSGSYGGDTAINIAEVGVPSGTPGTATVLTATPEGSFVGAQDLFADTSLLTGASGTINDLRLAYRLQEWLEKNARGGTRYAELIRAHFDVKSQDSRLQRPEYIVGVKNPIQISEVLNMTGTVDAPQGAMAGHGVSYGQGNYGRYFCSEHGYIMGIMSIMPKTAYFQGIPKHFLKYTDPTELAWPTFGNLGEQVVLNREIMGFGGLDGAGTFGYTPRYMEYKTLLSRVCGDFRNSLLFWHMARLLDNAVMPALNGSFVAADPTDRIFAVTDEDTDHVWSQLMHHITVVRALPFYGTPTF